MYEVKFISYDGTYPNLCSGELILEINGKLERFNHALCSGGMVWFDDEWNEHIEQGEWYVSLPKEFEHLENIVTELVNENVECGCCGGCV